MNNIKQHRFVSRSAKPALLAVLLGIGVVSLALLVVRAGGGGGADHVRWDIISLGAVTNPGGVASALADADHKITFTGAGTFVAPASGGTSSAVTGGGTWETFGPGGVSTANGTYVVVGLASWEFANFQPPNPNDNIDDGKGANGNAVLRIAYSDGSQGILGVGCHGPGAPDGIQEGVIATKDFVTYWSREAPAPGVDANRTVFHVRQ